MSKAKSMERKARNFLPVDDEKAKADAAFDEQVSKKILVERDRSAWVLGWMLSTYKALYEYLQEMQAEAKD